jgi:hypothetical protein
MYKHQTNIISKELQRRAIDLTPIGLQSVAWSLKDSIKLLEDLRQCIILGGDLYSRTSNGITPMAENWSYEPEGSLGDALNSGQAARDYLSNALTWGQGKDIVVDLVVQLPKH